MFMVLKAAALIEFEIKPKSKQFSVQNTTSNS